MTDATEFKNRLTLLWKKGLSHYARGDYQHARWFDPSETAFLHGVGIGSHELYDFVEDFQNYGEPTLETFLEIQEIRRDYFLNVQKGKLSEVEVHTDALPSRQGQLGGHRWLPRIIAKARAKLRGELHHEIMYGCGGDREFLRQHGLRAQDFLRAVRDHEHDEAAILTWVNQHSRLR